MPSSSSSIQQYTSTVVNEMQSCLKVILKYLASVFKIFFEWCATGSANCVDFVCGLLQHVPTTAQGAVIQRRLANVIHRVQAATRSTQTTIHACVRYLFSFITKRPLTRSEYAKNASVCVWRTNSDKSTLAEIKRTYLPRRLAFSRSRYDDDERLWPAGLMDNVHTTRCRPN